MSTAYQDRAEEETAARTRQGFAQTFDRLAASNLELSASVRRLVLPMYLAIAVMSGSSVAMLFAVFAQK